MGTRTYLEEELVKAREKPKLRKVSTGPWMSPLLRHLFEFKEILQLN